MLGVWINCKDAWTQTPNHKEENFEQNSKEVYESVRLANKYPQIVKVISVGNESMVHWAKSYYVEPKIILNWVNYLQSLKQNNKLNSSIWITSSDNYASWGGGEREYHKEDLNQLIKAVDYISIHTYPFHDTFYNATFWKESNNSKSQEKFEIVNSAMQRAGKYVESQYQAVAEYVSSIGVIKPIHIGETGWSSLSSDHYGKDGSAAADEYKQFLYYQYMSDFSKKNNVSVFYFSAFDETWKDAKNPKGSENHYGLFTVKGHAKYVMWDNVDKGLLNGIGRGQSTPKKTFKGDSKKLMQQVLTPQ